ncbi:dihydroxyacetone kinase subunit DhaL [Niallia sp. FSL W8-0635]|uniref:dihydroxyacetone kinase subunit DhaL n=1 Tax=Niallia sp. FSL W8-0635 TaxID=2975337 RepID=UPI0030F78632
MENLSINETIEMMRYVSLRLTEYKNFLNEVDGAIGDGDHGNGIERGFKAVHQLLDSSTSYSTINELFGSIGKITLQSMGGASGVIFSQLFLGAGSVNPYEELSSESLATMMRAGLQQVKKFGKADIGDKTLIEALEPAVITLESSTNLSLKDALSLAVKAAEEGVEKSKEYPAKFGRAKFVKDRSIGKQDAGATTISLIFKEMYSYLVNDRQKEEK